MLDESKIPAVFRKKLPANLEKIKYGHYLRSSIDYPINLYLREYDIRVNENGSEIIPFLRGKSILISGATGFLGKILLEKLIRCCKDIGTIYIIVRDKKGKNIQDRMHEFLNNWVFLKLADIYPDFKKKVVGISGDFEEPGIGLTEESRKLIADKVNIIFHAAATVRFDDKIKKAVTINIKGTQEMIKIAKSCKNLDVFTYISSAFANCHVKSIGERFYEPLIDPYDLMSITDKCSDEVLDRITPQLLGNMPNTYALTKQISEDIVRRESAGITVCIQRPSVVIASVKEPVRSWVDTIYGPVGLVEGAALGLIHVSVGNSTGRADVVPADYVVNHSIAATYKTAKDRLTSEVQIFNFTINMDNYVLWRNFGACKQEGIKVGSTLLLWQHFFLFTPHYYIYALLAFLFHTIPAHIIDFAAERLGRKPLLRKAYKKIDKFCHVLSYFTLNEWTFDYSRTTSLWKNLNEKDKMNFEFDMENLNWKTYFDTYLVAMREFLVFEFLDNLDQGRIRLRWITVLHNILIVVVIGLLFYFCLKSVFIFIPLSITLITLYYAYENRMLNKTCGKAKFL